MLFVNAFCVVKSQVLRAQSRLKVPSSVLFFFDGKRNEAETLAEVHAYLALQWKRMEKHGKLEKTSGLILSRFFQQVSHGSWEVFGHLYGLALLLRLTSKSARHWYSWWGSKNINTFLDDAVNRPPMLWIEFHWEPLTVAGTVVAAQCRLIPRECQCSFLSIILPVCQPTDAFHGVASPSDGSTRRQRFAFLQKFVWFRNCAKKVGKLRFLPFCRRRSDPF